jgi:hypothetical protein
MSRNRLVAYVFGAVYLLIGLLGFLIVTDFLETNTDERLILFEINGLHNVVHSLVGVALLAAARAGYRAARSMNMAVGATYLLIAIIGLFIATTPTTPTSCPSMAGTTCCTSSRQQFSSVWRSARRTTSRSTASATGSAPSSPQESIRGRLRPPPFRAAAPAGARRRR